MHSEQDTTRSDDAQSTCSLNKRLAAHFRAHPGEWQSTQVLAAIGGFAGWRTRVSDLRIQHRMDIRNRQRRQRARDGRSMVISEYMFVGEPATGLLPLERRT